MLRLMLAFGALVMLAGPAAALQQGVAVDLLGVHLDVPAAPLGDPGGIVLGTDGGTVLRVREPADAGASLPELALATPALDTPIGTIQPITLLPDAAAATPVAAPVSRGGTTATGSGASSGPGEDRGVDATLGGSGSGAWLILGLLALVLVVAVAVVAVRRRRERRAWEKVRIDALHDELVALRAAPPAAPAGQAPPGIPA